MDCHHDDGKTSLAQSRTQTRPFPSLLNRRAQPKRNETTTIDLEQHKGNDSDEYDSPSDDDDLQFKAQLRNPPEMGESNAESAERTKRIEEDVAQMKKQRQWRREDR